MEAWKQWKAFNPAPFRRESHHKWTSPTPRGAGQSPCPGPSPPELKFSLHKAFGTGGSKHGGREDYIYSKPDLM